VNTRAGSTFVLVPMLNAFVQGDEIGLTRKFVSGVEEQQRHWPGPLHVLMQPTAAESDNLDLVRVPKRDLPFALTVCPLDSAEAAEVIGSAAVAQLGLNWQQTHLADLCARLGVPCAYVSEATLRTRIQIARAEVPNPFRLARRVQWEMARERQYRKVVAAAGGIQCNGTPTFDAYAPISRSPLLFFDTRVKSDQFATIDDLEARFRERRASGTLRLAFSGRLIAIKGVDQLVRVARELARLGRNFSLSICGAGDRESAMRAYVKEHGLEQRVDFCGNLDFERELLPFLTREVDLFVSCHPQGDPSCTYLETMACGVPIAGYANEAWAGLVRTSGCGWATPMDRPDRLAATIAALTDRDIEEQSLRTLEFAREHSFENEFRRRMEHFAAVAAG
jgi:glycosyltransferase involved in cell wall biosynthesis